MRPTSFLLLLLALLSGCIGNDIIFDTVEETVRITAAVDTLAVGDSFQFEARFTNNIGEMEERIVNWRSSAPAFLAIDAAGLAAGVSKGVALVTAEVILDNGTPVQDTLTVTVDDKTTSTGGGFNVRTGTIKTTSSYLLEGDFTLRLEGAKLIVEVAANYKASDRLPGLYVYLTNNPNSNKNAYEIGKVEVFQGAHRYEIEGVGLRDYDYLLYYCKPFSVKVGDGKISD